MLRLSEGVMLPLSEGVMLPLSDGVMLMLTLAVMLILSVALQEADGVMLLLLLAVSLGLILGDAVLLAVAVSPFPLATWDAARLQPGVSKYRNVLNDLHISLSTYLFSVVSKAGKRIRWRSHTQRHVTVLGELQAYQRQ